MSYTRNDSYLLSQDTGFQGRVRASLVYNATVISTEAWTVPFHRERQTYAVQILNSPETYTLLFCNVVAVEPNCISDATANGTVALTAGNVASQALLVTDAHIDSAISTYFNAFFRVPSA